MKLSIERAGIGPCPIDQLTDGDRATLTALASGKTSIVDIGTFLGGSAEALCEGMILSEEKKTLFTIDAYILNPEAFTNQFFVQMGNTHDEIADWCRAYLESRLGKYQGEDFEIVHGKGDSVEMARCIVDGSLDMVFIDGGHTYEQVLRDINAWVPKVKPGGIVAGHDYDRETSGVTKDYVLSHKDLEWDRASGIHCGVVAAVWESFGRFKLPLGETSIWIASVEDFNAKEEEARATA